MTVLEALKKHHKIEIELLLMHVLKKSKEFLYMDSAHRLTHRQTDRLTRMVARRLKGEPMAYILGYKDFFGLRFKVNRDVLIPRPETEEIVNKVLKVCKVHKVRSILDVGTGSGCIAISIAKGLGLRAKGVEIFASDISNKALSVAKKNTKKHHAKIKFIYSNLLKNIKQKFDIIIANLPYGWHGVKNRFSSVKDELKFEPKDALYTKEKGLYHIRRLLGQIAARKEKPKLIYLEFDPRQIQDLQNLIKTCLPKAKVKFYCDLNNLWRYAEIKK